MNPTFSLLFGGMSFEHEISIISAITIKNILKDHIKHFIFLDSSHHFYLIPSELMRADFFAQKGYKKCKKLDLCENGFQSSGIFKTSITPECLINLVHGADGEDGSLAALLDFYNIPFIGPRVESCVLSFNKAHTKALSKERDIAILDYEVITRDNKPTLPLPLILKPVRLGSSIGISVIKEQKDLDYGLDCAFEYDDCLLAEPFISGIKEYNLAGFKANGEYHFSIIEEPQKTEMLDFDKKYLDFSRDTKAIEANLTEELKKTMQDYFKKIYENTFEGALIRCDFFVHKNKVYLNEINPIPGSLAHYLFQDFQKCLNLLASSLPKRRKIYVDYTYINKIKKAK